MTGSEVVTRIAEAGTSGTGLSVVIAAVFGGMAGSILSDLWLDQYMTRGRGTAWVLSSSCLIVAVWAVMAHPFG